MTVKGGEMGVFTEIAFAAACKRLCLFTGTGFSRAVSGGEAPGWEELLRKACAVLDKGDELEESLFCDKIKEVLSLSEIAQVISIKFDEEGLSLKDFIAGHLSNVDLADGLEMIEEFMAEHSIDVITTNYDLLMEKIIGDNQCHSLCDGVLVPRYDSKSVVCHVHGSVSLPKSIVVTADDYYNFVRNDNYVSNKVKSILRERMVIILGYSLGDENLKYILSDYCNSSKTMLAYGTVVLFSRSPVEQHVKDYYASCFNIRVFDGKDIESIFINLSLSKVTFEFCLEFIDGVRAVLSGEKRVDDEYINDRSCLFNIMASIGAIGKNFGDRSVLDLIDEVLRKKKEYTRRDGAWGQYTHLAEWLIYISSAIDLTHLEMRDSFLSIVRYSMDYMGEGYGLAWAAYNKWSDGWSSIRPENRKIIKRYMHDNAPNRFALRVIDSL